MARSLENVNGADLSNRSAVTGIGSMLLPLNLYIPPLSEGIIRTNCPLLVSWNSKCRLLTDRVQHTRLTVTCFEHGGVTVILIPANPCNAVYSTWYHSWFPPDHPFNIES